MNQEREQERERKAAEADPSQAMLRPWIDFWTQMLEQRTDWAQMMLAGAPPNVDFQTLRKRWLDTLTKSIDAYLRTPAFLEAMRKNFDSMTAFKTTSELAKRELSRQAGVPHVEDISGLYERLQMSHELVMEKLAEIERRLVDLETRLGEKRNYQEAES